MRALKDIPTTARRLLANKNGEPGGRSPACGEGSMMWRNFRFQLWV